MPSVAVRRKAFPKFSPRLYAHLKVGSTTEPRLQNINAGAGRRRVSRIVMFRTVAAQDADATEKAHSQKHQGTRRRLRDSIEMQIDGPVR